MKVKWFILLAFISIFNTYAGYCLSKDHSQKLAKAILNKLIHSIDTFPSDKRPVDIFIKDKNIINAYAIPKREHSSYKNFTIEITSGAIQFFNANPDQIAFLIAHELGHILLNHLAGSGSNNNKRVDYYSREQEKEADLLGMKILLKAGYSYKSAIDAMKKMKFENGDQSSFEALSSDHPSWTQRLSYLDSSKADLWRSMASFENGVYFLEAQNYEIAIILFKNVINEFPSCYEAYANIGYAKLMEYFHGFDTETLLDYHTGQLAMGGFYKRPASMDIKIKGIDEEKWWDAVGYLRQSLLINDNQPLVKSNLGIAYYFDPRRGNNMLASKYLTQAINELEKDTTLDNISKAVVYNNLAALNIYNENNIEFPVDQFIAKAAREVSNNYSYSFSPKSTQVSNTIFIKEIIQFNSYLSEYLHSSTSSSFLADYETFLENFLSKNKNNPHIWWVYTYTLYSDVCKKNNRVPKNEDEFGIQSPNSDKSPVTSVSCNDSCILYLSQDIKEVNRLLGSPDTIYLSKELKLFEYIYSGSGIKIIGTDEVLSICLFEGCSCGISIQDSIETRFLQVDQTIPGNSSKFKALETQNAKNINSQKGYFLDDLGLCIFINDTRKIKKIQITQYPYFL